MSWPATVAIKRDGRTHYMGTGIYDPVPKLAMGPEKLADNYLRHGEDLGALCIGWSDSGILVDFDANLLLYFGGESDSELGFRKVLNAYLMTGPWKGWYVRYAPREMVDFALELGVDWPAMSWLDSGSTELDLGTVVNYWLKKGVCMDTEKASSAMIMRSRGKDIVHVFDSYNITSILDHGETLIEFLDCPGVERRAQHRWRSGLLHPCRSRREKDCILER